MNYSSMNLAKDIADNVLVVRPVVLHSVHATRRKLELHDATRI